MHSSSPTTRINAPRGSSGKRSWYFNARLAQWVGLFLSLVPLISFWVLYFPYDPIYNDTVEADMPMAASQRVRKNKGQAVRLQTLADAYTMSARDDAKATASLSNVQAHAQLQTSQQQQRYPPIPPSTTAAQESESVSAYVSSNANDISGTDNIDTHSHAELSDFDPARFPVLPSLSRDASHPVSIVVIEGPDGILRDGVDKSRFVQLQSTVSYKRDTKKAYLSSSTIATTPAASDPSTPIVYLVDWMSLERDCHALEKSLKALRLPTTDPSDTRVLVYVDMSLSSRVATCVCAEQWFARTNIRLAKRSIVRDRYWNGKAHWVEPGQLIDNNWEASLGGPIVHFPQFLRESYVRQTYNVTGKKGRTMIQKGAFVDFQRSLDVAHFWRKGITTHYNSLRNHISSTITSMNSTRINKHSLKVMVRIQGDEDQIYANEVSYQYIVALFATKIVVVAQQDEWEDHYRLLESMASGALVLSDAMLAVPRGIENGTDVVMYDSDESLKNLILHYLKNDADRLAIARNGMRLAWEKHRLWYKLETLLFGSTGTGAGASTALR
jgi:Glycosyl transferases group 1